jgi:hypothetical protein
VVAPVELLDQAAELAADCGRPDLQRRLTLAAERARAPGVRVLVVGEPGKGKSMLVNALVGAPVCAVGATLASERGTTVPTVVRGGQAPAASLVFTGSTGRRGSSDGAEDGATVRVPVPVEKLLREVARAEDPSAGRSLVRVEAELPRQALAGGLELVDTPGVGGVTPTESLRTLDLLPTADAILVVSDASQEFTAPELAFLRQCTVLCPTVVCVLTKTDVHQHWRRVADLDRKHLADAGLDVEVLPVATPLELLAVKRGDADLRAESGFPAVLEQLRRVARRTEGLTLRSIAHDLTSVAEQVTLSLQAELQSLRNPAGNVDRVRDLEQARARMEDLGHSSSRWQTLLGDGVTDLMADIDYDLRDRSRVIVREAEETIDARDPGPLWPEFADWLERRVAEAVADSFVWASQRSEFLATQVIDQFTRDGAVIVPEIAVGDPDLVLRDLVALGDVAAGTMTLREKMFISLRGSYTGVLMVGLITSLAGMPLLNPYSIAAGVLLGRKSYKDDATARLDRRRNEAKMAVRRHLDEVVFQVSKHLKDRLRVVHRTLRDLIGDRAQELSRTMNEALQGAQQAVRADSADREARTRRLVSQLQRVERLTAQVVRLDAVPASAR